VRGLKPQEIARWEGCAVGLVYQAIQDLKEAGHLQPQHDGYNAFNKRLMEKVRGVFGNQVNVMNKYRLMINGTRWNIENAAFTVGWIPALPDYRERSP
jgi:hypothetical protein